MKALAVCTFEDNGFVVDWNRKRNGNWFKLFIHTLA